MRNLLRYIQIYTFKTIRNGITESGEKQKEIKGE